MLYHGQNLRPIDPRIVWAIQTCRREKPFTFRRRSTGPVSPKKGVRKGVCQGKNLVSGHEPCRNRVEQYFQLSFFRQSVSHPIFSIHLR